MVHISFIAGGQQPDESEELTGNKCSDEGNYCMK